MGEPMLEFNQLPPQPDGAVHYLEGHGGDTSNAAVAAARQGASVGYITAIGQDAPGDSFIALWAREGVDTATVIRTDRAQTGVYFVTHDAAGHHFLHYRKDSPAALYAPADLPRAGDRGGEDVLRVGHQPGHFDSAPPMRCSRRSTSRASTGVKVAYDTNYRPRLWPPARAAAVMHAAIAQADYVFPGMEDALVLTGLTDPDAILDFYLRARLPGRGAEDGRGRRLSRGCASAAFTSRRMRCGRWTRPAPATRSAARSWPASWPATRRSRRRAMPTWRRR